MGRRLLTCFYNTSLVLGSLIRVKYPKCAYCPRAHIAKFCDRLRLIRSILRAYFFCVYSWLKLLMWAYHIIPFGLSFLRGEGITLSLFKHLYSIKDHWWGLSAQNAHKVHIVNLIRFKIVCIVEVSFCNCIIMGKCNGVFL